MSARSGTEGKMSQMMQQIGQKRECPHKSCCKQLVLRSEVEVKPKFMQLKAKVDEQFKNEGR